MVEKNDHREENKNLHDEESLKIDQELQELIVKNESFKKGITKLVEGMDKLNSKELNQ